MGKDNNRRNPLRLPAQVRDSFEFVVLPVLRLDGSNWAAAGPHSAWDRLRISNSLSLPTHGFAQVSHLFCRRIIAGSTRARGGRVVA